MKTRADGRLVFEYAILRIVPRVERGECLNVGVLVYCQPADLLVAKVHLDHARLTALAPDLDLDAVGRALDGVHRVCAGGAQAGPAGDSSLGQRFRWLTSPRSTIVQTGPAHAGLTQDPVAEPDRLLDLLVR
ncbi:MAG TPA: DUF3037 domain-containing protein [Frankiaceae bacterium]|nr:DUF3037 domain-containing protein [Frankiaceae bacterium]